MLIGERVRRVEDRALITGVARYTGDLAASAGAALEVAFVRSTMAHARITSVQAADAIDAPGVIGVFDAGDFGDISGISAVPIPTALIRPLLATERVRFVGEIVAVVVATSQSAAVDAAESVFVDYEPLPSSVTLEQAGAPGSPLLFEELASNQVLGVEGRPGPQFADADIVVSLEIHNQRVAVAPLEPNAILAEPDGAGGLLVHLSTQAPHALRDGLAQLCGLEQGAVRVIAPWVGGGFGAKSVAEPEYALVCRLALRLGRPVRWRQTRTENLLTMHGRDQLQRVQIALDGDGTLRAIHADLIPDNGAYPGINHFLAGLTAKMMAGTYRVESATASITSLATNTAPPTGYRGAGRPEAASLVERSIDVVAAVLGHDPAALRRANLIGPDAFPYESPAGATYDSGDYGLALDRALEIARYDERRAEQAQRRATGDRRLLGIGISCYVEVTGGAGPTEFSDVEVHPDATVTVRVGTFGHGQGHRTTYAQIVADALGVPFDAIRVIDGDTALVARGVGTFGSRSMQTGGSSIHASCLQVVETARRLAADLLEASPDDVVHGVDGFSVAGVPSRGVAWAEVAMHADRMGTHQRDESRIGLYASLDWERRAPTFPFGAHVSIVEVDADTGKVTLVEHVAVDDCGIVLNPLLAEGQVHGGIAQGVAQALLEEIVYDSDGNLLTTNFADYAIISATELPSFTLDHTVTPTPLNALGAKGIGESGTIGATPAVQNAVVDALAHLGVLHIDMPCTPEKVWRAINGESIAVRVTRR
jgi:carbon-monoxide dehydrogenase large subunit